MSQPKIPESIRAKVEKRAGFRCEYCQTTIEVSTQRFEMEHIIPVSKGGESDLRNLALACRGCNAHKQNKIQGFDEVGQSISDLYNPRTHNWSEHFAWDTNPIFIIGLSPEGRATIHTLKLNRPELLSIRKLLQKLHMHPPI